MMRERGLQVDHTTIYRWGKPLCPGLDKRCRPQLKTCNDSWRVDEISINIKKSGRICIELWIPNASRVKALYSPADSAPQGHPIKEQVAQPTVAADLPASRSVPQVINVEKNAAYPKAIAQLKAMGTLPESVEPTPGLNISTASSSKIITRMKRLVKPGLGFFSFETAGRTLQGYARDEHDQKGANAKGRQRRHPLSSGIHRSPV